MAVNSGVTDRIKKITRFDKNYTIRIGTPTAGKNEQNYVMELFEAYIEGSTAGTVQVELYPASQLGTAQQMIQNVLDLSLTGVVIPLEYFYTYAPASGIVSVPYLFTGGSAQAKRIFDSDPTMNDYLKSKGLYPVVWLYEHSFTILADRKLDSMDDFKGMKTWVLPSTISKMELEAYGAAPTLMDPSDIALAMQNGTVDAAFTGVTFFNNMKLQDHAKYLNKLPLKPLPCVMMFATDWMESIPQELADLIVEGANMIVEDYEKEYVKTSIENSVKAVLEKCEEVIPSEEFLAELRKATQSVHDFYKNTDADCAKMYDKMVELIEKDNATYKGENLPY